MKQPTKLLLLCSLISILCICSLSACGIGDNTPIKLRDLDFTILSDEVLPEELKTMLAQRCHEPFRLTYSDKDALYICIGYGEQQSGGYSITVDELYLTEDAIHVETTLLGPDSAASEKNTPSYPYIVIRTEKLEQTVIAK